MKRVLIFSLSYYPRFVGGAEVAIKEITDRISPEEIEFHMVTLRFDSKLPRTEKVGNITVHRIGFSNSSPTTADLKKFPLFLNKYWYQFAATWEAARLHGKYRFDALWAMMAHSSGVPAALFKIFRSRVPYLLVLQEGDPLEYIEQLARPVWPLFSRAFTSADAVVAESTFLGHWARRRGFRGSMEVIPNGMDAARLAQKPGAELLESIRTKIGKKEGETWLIHTGRLVPKNALDVVIRALPLLPESVHFFMIGDGPDANALAKLARECAVSARVHFHPYVPLEEVPNYLKACDIFVRPSRSEGMGNSFIEAMAAGLPIVATQEGGISDFLFDAKRNPDKETTGWALDKDSPEQIAKAVKDILAHPEEVARVTIAAKKLALEKYDWNLIAGSMRAVFDRLLGKSRNTIMRLVLATPLYPPDIGGPATYAKLLFEGLPAKGIEVELVKFSDVRHLPKFIRHIAYYRRVVHAARHADAVLALDPVSVGLPVMRAAKKARKPFVVKIVGDYAWEQGRQRFGITQNLDDFVATGNVPFPAKMLRRVQTRVARSAARVIVPSNYLANIVAAWGIPREKITVIYNSVELPEMRPPRERPAGFLIVSAGRRVPWKGFDALERVAARDGGWRLFIASGLPRAETLGWVRAADVFVLNSAYEGLSHALIEAMMLGTPVVATKVGGNPELIEDGVNGLLIPPGDDEALFEALSAVARDPEAARARAASARARAGAFSTETMLAATATVLENL